MIEGLQHATNGSARIAFEVRGSGDPLLLIQGLGYGRSGWGQFANRLAEDFTVIAYDNRGFGESDKPAGPYSTSELGGDAAAVLDAAGIERAHVLGVSLGGMVAQELALAEPQRIRRLVLLSTTPGGLGSYPMPARTVQLMLSADSLPPETALRRFVENALADGALQPELVEQILAYRLAHPPDPAGWSSQAAAGAAHDALRRLAQIQMPTLVVHGVEDAVVDARNGELIARTIPGAELTLLEECGHLPFWEQPTELADVVRAFLEAEGRDA
jgi:3-oxoadipate enol-lactonase